MEANQIIAKEFIRGNENFITLSLLICLILYALVNVFYARRLKQIFKSFIDQRSVNQLVRDGNILKETISLLLYINYFISVSILIYKFSFIHEKISLFETTNNSNPEQFLFSSLNGIILFFEIFVAFLLYFLLKVGIIRMIGIVFKTSKITTEYLQLLFIFNQSAGLIILPLIIINVYLKINFLIYFSFIFLSVILLYRIIRIIFNRICPSNFSLFYLFLYLCTIEFLPLLIFLKLIYRALS